jgi:hypothetical protein
MDTRGTIAKWAAGAIILLLAIFALATPFVLTIWADYAELPTFIILPLVAIAGISVLFASLALVAISFATFGLSNNTQPVGLPEGSIRSFIALSLVVVFAIVAFTTYGDLAKPLKTGETANAEAVNFARQLLTLTGTLVTAVASFYFGTQAAGGGTTGTGASGGQPLLRNIDPSSHSLANGLTLPLKIRGDNLDMIKEVKIVKGNEQIPASQVHSNASEITCEIPLQANSAGIWDVIVTDSSGRQAQLAQALTITA